MASRCSAVSFPFSIALLSCFSMPALPRWQSASDTSRTRVAKPLCGGDLRDAGAHESGTEDAYGLDLGHAFPKVRVIS